MSKKRKTPSKRSAQVRVPEAQNPRLAKLAKVAKVVSNSLDIKTFQWVAAMVFGLALDAERAQAAQAAQAENEANLADAQYAGEEAEPSGLANADQENLSSDGQLARGDELDDPRTIHLSPRSEMLLAQIATAPLNDSLDSLSQLKQFFAGWFSKHPAPKVTNADIAAGVDPVLTRDQAITQAIERAAIEFNSEPGSTGITTTTTELREMYPQQAGGGAQLVDINLPLQFANEASGADVTRFAENAPNLGEMGNGSEGGFDPMYLTGLLGGLAGVGGGGGAAAAVAVASTAGIAAGGGAVAATSSAAIAGAAIDGLIQGATVNLQALVNGKWVTELQTTTDATGSYGFDLTKAAITNAAAVAEINAAKAISASNIRVVIEAGGYDQNTGQQVGQLVAGATVQHRLSAGSGTRSQPGPQHRTASVHQRHCGLPR